MECTLSSNGIKALHRAVTCLSRIGADLLIEALPDKMTLRSLNSARSAFLAITFRRHFFDRYLLSSQSAQCSVLLKAVCTVLRTQPSNMDRLSITLPDSNATKLKWTIGCLNGLRKTYWITCNNDIEMQHVAIERSSFSSYLISRPRDLSRLLSNFQSNLLEITLIATEPVRNDSEGKAVELRSYIDPAKETSDGALHTQLWIDPAEELRDYNHVGDPVDVTFSMKELKAFMNFCEGAEADVQLYFEKAGSPILLAPRFSIDDAGNADCDATLVLATMLNSQLGATDEAQQQPINASRPPTQNRTPQAAAVNPPRENPPRSDHTVIWSELSGTSEQAGPGNRVPSRQRETNFPDSGDATEELPLHRHEQQRNAAQEKQPVQPENVAIPPEDDNDIDMLHKECSARQLFGKDMSNWIAADSEEESDEDGFCVQATPPHRRM